MRATIGAAIFGVILMLVTAGQPTGADYRKTAPGHPDRNGIPTGDKVGEARMPREKSDSGETEWYPDPQRGWVRVEQPTQKDRDNPRNKNSDNNANNWEY
ncbi:MAG TPA: hypothetical protein VHL99_01725 [Candidatus Binatia bacterium]|jgi:hypothetical protein|nr:hypothetical protein [Candidatus Binatia bacterium]